MSLRVWLPLNGNLDNQGLDQVTVTNNGAVVDNNGKIGKCYSFDGSDDYIAIPIDLIKNLNNAFSISFWVNFLSFNTSYQTVFSATGSNASWNQQIICFQRYGTSSSFLFEIGNGNTSTAAALTTNNLVTNTWYHFTLVYYTGKIIIYQNGIFIRDYNVSFSPGVTLIQNVALGRSHTGYYSNMKLNDFRIYDHALSPLEIKQISQGLILHYPLNRNGWGQENLLLNTHFDSQYSQTSGWDTSKNGTHLASSWGGYNSGVSNPSTVYHAHLKEFNGEWVYEFIKTTNENWLGISQSGLQTKITPGNIYTFSWEQYCESGNNYNHGGLYYYKTGASSANFHLGLFTGNTNRKIGQWQKYSYTFTAPTDGDYNKGISWYIYGMSGGNGVLYTRHLKLEEGSIATPWCPNSADELATTLGLNDNVEYDTSGYGNNGEYYAYDSSGSIEYNSNTPKYNICTFINSDNNTTNTASGTRYLYGHCGLTNPNQMTVAFWCKPVAGYTGGTSQGQFCTTNIAFGDTGAGSDYQASAMNHRDGAININDSASATQCNPIIDFIANEWHHYAVTYDGQNGKTYRDGIIQDTKSFNAVKILDSFIGVIIGFSKAGGVWRSNKSYYSDFRIYATALSAEDVLSLYNNSAYIDNQGNLYGSILREV